MTFSSLLFRGFVPFVAVTWLLALGCQHAEDAPESVPVPAACPPGPPSDDSCALRCDPGTGKSAQAPAGAPCTLSGLCPGTGACDAAGHCLGKQAPACDPGTGKPPPSPMSMPPVCLVPLDRTVPSSVAAAVRVLYDPPVGCVPLQTPITSGPAEPPLAQVFHDPARLSALHGFVRTPTGQPIPGVTVTLLGHPEDGQTRTRADGRFDLAMVGGGALVVSFVNGGYLPVQRRVLAPAGRWLPVPDVVMIAPDSHSTALQSKAPVLQVLEGSPVADVEGPRTARVFVPAGTEVRAAGAALGGAPVAARLTEYTVGPSGPAALPGTLPRSSAYTYAVEYSLDGHEGETITFAKSDGSPASVIAYVENFTKAPVGSDVPAGYYDRAAGAWKAGDNGRVLQITGLQGGQAQIDSVGQGATVAPLTDLDADELAHLGSLYPAGTTLWRVRLAHFTAWDFNFPYGPSPTASAPPATNPGNAGQNDLSDGCSAVTGGSIISCENQSLGQEVPVTGTGFGLHYVSDRVPGRTAERTITVQLKDGTAKDSPVVHFEADIAGQHAEQQWAYADAPTSLPFTWDGNDGLGRPMQGAQPATLRVGYEYPAQYYPTRAGLEKAFGRLATEVADPQTLHASVGRSTTTVTLWREWQTPIGTFDAQALGLGGWMPTNYHLLDVTQNILYRGDGVTLRPTVLGSTIHSIPADVDAPFHDTAGIGTLADGRVVIVAQGNTSASPAWRLQALRDGSTSIDTLAGVDPALNAGNCHSDASGVAASASFCTIASLAVSRSGDLFVAEVGDGGCDWRVRRIQMSLSPAVIDTVAGAGSDCQSGGDGHDAASATFSQITALAAGADGSVYVFDRGRVRHVVPGGTIATVAGTGVDAVPDRVGEAATVNSLPHAISSLAVDVQGRLYLPVATVSDTVYRVELDGTLQPFAGGGPLPPLDSAQVGDGGKATSAYLGRVHTVAVSDQGLVLIWHQYLNGFLRLVDAAGLIHTVAHGPDSVPGYSATGDGGLARTAALYNPGGLAFDTEGRLFAAEQDTNHVRVIAPLVPGRSSTALAVPSKGGGELFVFDSDGRPTQTVDPWTGATRVSFVHAPRSATDPGLLLTEIHDVDGRVATLDRTGDVIKITSPDGPVTQMHLDSQGWADSIALTTLAAGAPPLSVSMMSSADGLMQSFVDPRKHTHVFTYQPSDGRLAEDDEPAATDVDLPGSKGATGFKHLTLSTPEPGAGWQVDVTTSEGRTTSHRVSYAPGGSRTRLTLAPDGTASSVLEAPDGTVVATVPATGSPDAATVTDTSTRGPSARFGLAAPFIASRTVTMGAGGPGMTVSAEQSPPGPSSDPARPFGQASQTGTQTINGNVWTTSFASQSGQATVTVQGPTLGSGAPGRQAVFALDPSTARVVGAQWPGQAPVHIDYVPGTGRPKTITQAGRQSQYVYDANGFLTTVTAGALANGVFAPAQSTTVTNDGAGRVTTVTQAPDATSAVTWTLGSDENDNLTTLTTPSPAPHVHAFAYDEVDRVASYAPPDVGANAGTTTYTYSADGAPSRVVRADGWTLQALYDPSPSTGKRLTGLTSSASMAAPNDLVGVTLGVGYDATGRVATVTGNDSESLAVKYQGALVAQVTSAGVSPHAMRWTYDNDFRVLTESVDGAETVSYGYDTDGTLLSATHGNDTLSLQRDPATASLTQLTLGALTESRTYDGSSGAAAYGEETGRSTSWGTGQPALLDRQVEARDALGRVLIERESLAQGAETHRRRYVYDGLGRLTKAFACGSPGSDPGCDQQSLLSTTYDAQGNRLTHTGSMGWGSGAATYDAQDRLTSAPNLAFTYQPQGERHTRTRTDTGETSTYSYDVLGHLRQVDRTLGADTTRVAYTLNPLGRRVQRVVRHNGVTSSMQRFSYLDALRPAAEYDGTNALIARFVYATQRNVPDFMVRNESDGQHVYALVTDERGSVRLVVDTASGKVRQRIDYDPWGNVLLDTAGGESSPFQPFGFAGGLYDRDTRLVHFGAREYDPEVGRWTTKDPTDLGGGFNLYGYAFNDPITYVDVNGSHPVVAIGVAVGVVLLGGALVQSNDDAVGISNYAAILGGGAVLSSIGAGVVSASADAEISSSGVGTMLAAIEQIRERFPKMTDCGELSKVLSSQIGGEIVGVLPRGAGFLPTSSAMPNAGAWEMHVAVLMKNGRVADPLLRVAYESLGDFLKATVGSNKAVYMIGHGGLKPWP